MLTLKRPMFDSEKEKSSSLRFLKFTSLLLSSLYISSISFKVSAGVNISSLIASILPFTLNASCVPATINISLAFLSIALVRISFISIIYLFIYKHIYIIQIHLLIAIFKIISFFFRTIFSIFYCLGWTITYACHTMGTIVFPYWFVVFQTDVI